VLLGSAYIKAARKTLMKLTPDVLPGQHDVGLQPVARQVPDSRLRLPRKGFDERGRGSNAAIPNKNVQVT